MNYIPILLALLDYSFASVLPRAGCSISVRSHLSEPQPLLLLQNEATKPEQAFPLPVDTKGTLTFTKGQKIDLSCPGTTLVISGSNTGKSLVEAQCASDTKFVVEGKSVTFKSITCRNELQQTARYTGKKCGGKYREIEIGYKVGNRFLRHIISCFDDALQNVVYTHFNMTSAIGGFQSSYPRPVFEQGSFYNVKPDNVNYLYTKNGQRKTINKLLGLSNKDTSVIQNGNNFFLARGHLTAKGDFVFGSQQNLTFWYINAAPQWQTFNGGNWNTAEGNCRSLASDRDIDLAIYTGTHEVASLPDVNGNEQSLYLWTREGNRHIPVPAVYYKVVYEPKTKAGIVLIGLNNPYKTNVNDYVYCKDVCNQVKWLSWKKENITLGYSYCCEVNDFRKVVKVLPYFEVKSLLV